MKMSRSGEIAFFFIAIILVAIAPPTLARGYSPSTGRTPPGTGTSPSTGSPSLGGRGGFGTPSTPGTSGGNSCPINALKLGACVDLLKGLAHVVVGDPVVNQCCPILQGVLELEAALCFCTTIRAKILNLNIFLPLSLELLAICGTTPPPGFQCPPLN